MDTFDVTYFGEVPEKEQVTAIKYELHAGWFIFWGHNSNGQMQQVHRIRETDTSRIDLAKK